MICVRFGSPNGESFTLDAWEKSQVTAAERATLIAEHVRAAEELSWESRRRISQLEAELAEKTNIITQRDARIEMLRRILEPYLAQDSERTDAVLDEIVDDLQMGRLKRPASHRAVVSGS